MNFKGSVIMGKTKIEKHKNRFKNFITYDLKGRTTEEQEDILKVIIEVAEDVLNNIKLEGENE